MFQLTQEEWNNLRFQNGTSSWGGRRTLPYAFTEHGAIMLASVLNSETAVKASLYVVRAFIRLRDFLTQNKELAQKLNEFENKTVQKLTEHDKKFQLIFDTLKQVLIQEIKPKNPIGFIP